jgi:hypothetical protein
VLITGSVLVVAGALVLGSPATIPLLAAPLDESPHAASSRTQLQPIDAFALFIARNPQKVVPRDRRLL